MKAESPCLEAATALLRRFEPVIRSTTGDKFYPMDVEPYVRACSLWVQRPGEEAVCVVPSGELSLDRLAQQPMDEAGAVHFLKFTDKDDLGPDARGKRVFLRRAMDRKESRRAYRAHNYTGDNLRRRWDDPEVEKVGEHPVIYVGAGSHASYFAPGEYLTELTLPLPSPLARTANSIRSFWETKLGQYVGEGPEGGGYFSIPFVDYARGDGLTVGDGGDRAWEEPRLLADPIPDWVSGYRGLWGLYARDPFEGEDAPAGPRSTTRAGASRNSAPSSRRYATDPTSTRPTKMGPGASPSSLENWTGSAPGSQRTRPSR